LRQIGEALIDGLINCQWNRSVMHFTNDDDEFFDPILPNAVYLKIAN
jgi:hypothetical protein